MQIQPAYRYAHFTDYSASRSDERKLGSQTASAQTLTEQQQSEVEKLKQRDQEVRAHEQAHLNAAGGIAMGGASFQYVTGADGKRYATGGEVSIDTSAVANNPEATIRKAESIRRAAMAPAQPSGQDHAVASAAQAMAAKARIELLQANSQNSLEQNRAGSLFSSRA